MNYMDLLKQNHLRNMFASGNGQFDPNQNINTTPFDPNSIRGNGVELLAPNNNDELINRFNNLPIYPESNIRAEMPMQERNQFPTQGNYRPETSAMERFNSLMAEYPDKPKPGWGRKIGGILAGTAADLAGSNGGLAANRIMFGDYDERMKSWKDQITPAQQAADNERGDNSQRRMYDQSIRTNEAANRRIDETERKNRETIQLAQERERRIAKHEADIIGIKKFLSEPANKAKYPQVGNDGYLYLIDRVTGESTRTNVLTGELSDIQAAELGLKNALTRIGAQGDETRETEEVRQGNRQEIEATRQGNRESLLKQRSEEWNLLPTQKRQLIQHNAEQLIRQYPNLKDIIQINDDGMIDVVEARGAEKARLPWNKDTTEFTEEDRNEVIKKLNEGISSPRRSTTQPPNSPSVGSKVGNRIKVKNKATGATGTILESDFNASKYEKLP